MNKRLMFAIAAMVSVGILMVGCGKKVGEKAAEKLLEKAIEKQGGGKAKVDITDGSMKVVTDKGEVSASYGAKVEVSKDWPADVPVYKNGTVTSSMKVPEGFHVIMNTSDSQDKVIENMKSDLTSKGWTEEASINLEQQKTASFKKEERRVMVTTLTDGGKTLVTITVAKGG